MGLLLRRREMMLAVAPAPSEWDAEWYYTDGLPSNFGWIKSGADTPTVTSNKGLFCKRTMYTKDIPITNGIIEARFVWSGNRPTLNGHRAHLRIGDTDNAIYVIWERNYSAYGGSNWRIWYYSTSSVSTANTLGVWSESEVTTARLIINGSVASVEVNDVVLKENINTAQMQSKGTLMFGNDHQYDGCCWQYVKYKNLDT